MLDPISVASTLGLFAAGWLFGRHARLKRTPERPQLRPMCMCAHHYGAHDPQTGACQAQDKERFQRSPGGNYRDVWVDCPCVRYTGPQPVEQYWVPPAADMSIVVAPRPVDQPTKEQQS